MQDRENIAVQIHRELVMARRVRQLAMNLATVIPDEVVSLLDVGAGTGELACAIHQLRPDLDISGVDVYIRPKTLIPVRKYDGSRLPFDDASMDAVMAVDVLHHCKDPISVLRECARVSREWIIIKDHTADKLGDKQILRFMDWVGNRAHGVELPYNYLSTTEWAKAFRDAGLASYRQINTLGLYPFPFSLIFDGSLHCLHLLKKS